MTTRKEIRLRARLRKAEALLGRWLAATPVRGMNARQRLVATATALFMVDGVLVIEDGKGGEPT